MSFFLAPRARPVIYTPNYNITKIKSSEDIKTSILKKFKTGLKRVIQDNVPILSKLTKSTSFILPGVQHIDWAYVRDISEQYGLQSYSLLPWYTKAISVTVEGKYYMGAFVQDSLAATVSNLTSFSPKSFIEWAREEMANLDKVIKHLDTSADQTIYSALRIGSDDDSNALNIVGFIKKIKFDETVESPFVQAYTIEYLGVDKEWYAFSTAAERYNKDHNIK